MLGMRQKQIGMICQDRLDQLQTKVLSHRRKVDVLWLLSFCEQADVIEDLDPYHQLQFLSAHIPK